MTVFKTFLKVLNKYKATIILYTVILIAFVSFNMKTESNQTFTATKPDVLIVDNDKSDLSSNLVKYMSKKCEIKKISDDEDKIKDALFYRDISYIIYIPKNYANDFMKDTNPEIKIKQTGDYESSLAEMELNRYLKIANIYQKSGLKEQEIIDKINTVIKKETEVELTSSLDINSLGKTSFYYNFLNYSLLAGCVYVICLTLSSFRKEQINKRTIISSINYKSYNRKLLLSNGLFAIIMWLLYVLLIFILLGNIVISSHGLLYIINSFIFTICSLTIAFLIGNLISNKNAINGIINVVALGSSFLCGAFVSAQYLPESVLNIAHFLPSYWYIKNNDLIATIENINFETLKPIIGNTIVVILFSIVFVVLSNCVYKKKRKIG